MNLELTDGLLFSSVVITYRGKSVTIRNVVIDTGAAESIISIDAVDDLFHSYEPDDQIRFMRGIGGREAAIRRKVDHVRMDTFVIKDFRMDFGPIGEYDGINGLIGLDVLIPGKFIVDLSRMQLYTADSQVDDK
ncbi:retropepsin-like aspartic protease [Thermicanus aegyptius]|uniref:retropepsin-like aspartic protease n=1 Tax=Thermicanus aegyptius TaxID=94009 RepID=UPI00048F9B62|nr:retropepsin-like aspartic protease [Thermicanus aegyptius]